MFEPCPPKSLKGGESVRRVRSLLWALISVVLASAIAIVPASAATSRAPAPQAPKSDSSNASSLSDNPVIRQFVKTVGTDEIENQNALEAFRAWMFTRPGCSPGLASTAVVTSAPSTISVASPWF
jgi:hypothetical protein